MNAQDILIRTNQFLNKNKTTILTSLAISGVVGVIALATKATFESAKELEEASIPEDASAKEKAKVVWKNYIPTAIVGSATIGCIVAAQKVGAKKAVAAQAAFVVSERLFSEYKEKVAEQIGTKKEKAIRDAIAQDKVTKDNPDSKQVIVTGSGVVLCCEGYTGRYFNSDMESLRKAENTINSKLISHDYASLSDLYYLLKIPETAVSDKLGWDSGRLLQLDFSTTLTPAGQPCLVFNYNYVKPS
jgi:hypothetical protein